MVYVNSVVALVAIAVSITNAHPGQSHASKVEELGRRNEFISSLENKDLAQCAGKLAKRGELSDIVKRRIETLKALRRDRGISESSE